MRLKEWAKAQGVSTDTAYRWVREGTMPVPFRRAGRAGRTILVDDVAEAEEPTVLRVGLYARVSSSGQREDLDRQMDRLTAWAAAAGAVVVRSEREVGSGMNVGLVEAALAAHGRRLIVLDDGEVDDDLVLDMTEVLTSFCARRYGRRSAHNRARAALTAAENEHDNAGGDGDA